MLNERVIQKKIRVLKRDPNSKNIKLQIRTDVEKVVANQKRTETARASGARTYANRFPPFLEDDVFCETYFMPVYACTRDVLCVKNEERRNFVFHILNRNLKQQNRW